MLLYSELLLHMLTLPSYGSVHIFYFHGVPVDGNLVPNPIQKLGRFEQPRRYSCELDMGVPIHFFILQALVCSVQLNVSKFQRECAFRS